MPGRIKGQVTAITPDGNLVTSIASEQLKGAPRDERLTITCDEHFTQGLFGPDHTEPAMTLLGIVADGGFLELVLVGDSASAMLGIRVGQEVVVKWE